ncbi:chemotaxis protein CheW [Permianibacter sp. IMCC34836]|uniref:chemotaxis protein CheW n=1 Tax=Permianibacter fluminis TaxID=2738515 RepID=UPI00155339E8|nr:chemotaxis protein CheW [Permianibacter fluminis]NQD36149.1 chemotaxis protein CheW [Permianibacter fluminis]
MAQLPAVAAGGKSLQTDAGACQYLTFTLGGEAFAIPIEHVREIIEFNGLTTIPMMPPFLRGVINLRGAVVPVVDLQARFGRGETEINKRTCVIIVELTHDDETPSIGIMVDAVNEVLSVERNRLEAKPAFGTKIRADFIDGILNLDGRFIITLDIQQVLSIDEMASLIGVTDRPDALLAQENGAA